ncbi:MAG: thioredoxin domain-containing protein [Elusimicrobia bacterium]|nr:thioredoxin domain-containing protein [Elusimicrobiota bacterium]
MRIIAAIVGCLFAVCAARDAGAALSREELKKALDANPDLIIEALQPKRKELFDLVRQAAGEEEARAAKEREAAMEKEIDDAILKPLQPALDDKTRFRGNKKAKYTVVEYSDFQCPYCSRGFHTVEALRKKLGDDVRFVFKHKPLDFHPMAMPAALYMEALSLQSEEKAWQFHDKLFQNQDKLSVAFFDEVAKEVGADAVRLKKDLDNQAVKDKIKADMDEAAKLGFTGTPGFVFNGVPLRGAYPIEFFEKIVAKLEGKGAGKGAKDKGAKDKGDAPKH